MIRIAGTSGPRKTFVATVSNPGGNQGVTVTHNFGERADLMTIVGSPISDIPYGEAPDNYLTGVGNGVQTYAGYTVNTSYIFSHSGQWGVPNEWVVTIYKF